MTKIIATGGVVTFEAVKGDALATHVYSLIVPSSRALGTNTFTADVGTFLPGTELVFLLTSTYLTQTNRHRSDEQFWRQTSQSGGTYRFDIEDQDDYDYNDAYVLVTGIRAEAVRAGSYYYRGR